MVRMQKAFHNGVRVYGSRRNEQLPFKVLFISKKKKDGSYYKRTSLLSLRAALDRYVRSPPFNKKVSFNLRHCSVSLTKQLTKL